MGRSRQIIATFLAGTVALILAACEAAGQGAVDASATMVVEPVGELADTQEDGDRVQFRNLNLAGSITLTAGEQEITGEITFAESEDITFAGGGPMPEIVHAWGTASATLDDTACEGPFALSDLPSSGQGQGALILRCEDGSVFAGDLRDTPEIGPEGGLISLTRESDGSWSTP